MSTKNIKAAFGLSISSIRPEEDPRELEMPPEPGEDGIHPRTLHILDFALTNLFCAGYAVPHTDKVRCLDDTAEIMTFEELDAYEAEVATPLGKSISRAHGLPNPADSFFFEFLGLDDWAPCQISLFLCDREGESIEIADAPDALQDAYREFFYDLSMATTNIDGVRVKPDKGLIETNDPLALYKIIAELIVSRNDDAYELAEQLKKDCDDPGFPMEFRDIDLPQMGWEAYSPRGQDADLDQKFTAAAGSDFLYDDDTAHYALQNVPPRSYNSEHDLFLVLADIKGRMEAYVPMVRLDEMEAIIRNEVRKEKSYAPNPLLNLH